MHVNSNKFSFMILSIKFCNINDNSQCDEKVIRFYFFASVNISNSIFFLATMQLIYVKLIVLMQYSEIHMQIH